MNICVLGFFNKQNIGDESYKDTFKLLFPQHSFIFCNHIYEEIIAKSEAVILGGGNVLKPPYIEELKKVKNKPIFGFSVGIEDASVNIPKTLFKHIYARDEFTLKVLTSKGIPCSYIPDAAFSLLPNINEGKEWIKKQFENENFDLYQKIITVCINSYVLNAHLASLTKDSLAFLKFSYDFARIADETNASIVFLPFGTGMPIDDRIANSWVAAKCKYWKKNLVVFDRIDHKTSLNIIAASNLTVSSRLHSSIFSYVAGTPFVDITHHSKNANFLESIGKQNCSVDFWNFDAIKAKTLINNMINLPKHNEASFIAKKLWDTASAIHFS
jgi:polysaccharide pyruvyl transferase WcaK-like protein